MPAHAVRGLLGLALLWVALTGCGATYAHRVTGAAAISSVPVAYTGEQLAHAVHAQVNMIRRELGLSAVKWNSGLSPVAFLHSKDMAVRRFFAHENPDGEGPHERYVRGGYTCRVPVGERRFLTAGENIFAGHRVRTWKIFPDGRKVPHTYSTLAAQADRVVVGWLNSPPHRENMLKPQWRSEAIGVYIDAAGSIQVTQNFC